MNFEEIRRIAEFLQCSESDDYANGVVVDSINWDSCAATQSEVGTWSCKLAAHVLAKDFAAPENDPDSHASQIIRRLRAIQTK